MNSTDAFREVSRLHACLGHGLPQPYLLDAADIDLPQRSLCLAYATRPGHDAHLQQHIIDRGQWNGPAPVIVFDLPGIEADAKSCGYSFTENLWQIAIHELAHYREWKPADQSAELAVEQVELAREAHVEWAARPAWEPDVKPRPLWSEDHGHGFIRAALHLYWRAHAAGYGVPLQWLCAGFEYGLRPAWHFLEELGDEPQRMAGATLNEIAETSAPPAFNKLFMDDIEHFLRKSKA